LPSATSPSGAAPRAFTHHVTFGYTGKKQTFTVPSGVTRIRAIAVGANGGGTVTAHGGRVIAVIPIIPSETLAIYVAGAGTSSGGGSGTGGGGRGGKGGERTGGSGKAGWGGTTANGGKAALGGGGASGGTKDKGGTGGDEGNSNKHPGGSGELGSGGAGGTGCNPSFGGGGGGGGIFSDAAEPAAAAAEVVARPRLRATRPTSICGRGGSRVREARSCWSGERCAIDD